MYVITSVPQQQMEEPSGIMIDLVGIGAAYVLRDWLLWGQKCGQCGL